jgi:hypothetical protein
MARQRVQNLGGLPALQMYSSAKATLESMTSIILCSCGHGILRFRFVREVKGLHTAADMSLPPSASPCCYFTPLLTANS